MKKIKGGVNTTSQRIYDGSRYFAGFLIFSGILTIILGIIPKMPLFITIGVIVIGIILVMAGIIEYIVWRGEK